MPSKKLNQLEEVTSLTDDDLLPVASPLTGKMSKIKRKNLFAGYQYGKKVLFNSAGYYDLLANILLEKFIVLPGMDATFEADWINGSKSRSIPATSVVAGIGEIFQVDIYNKTQTVRINFSGLGTGSAIIFLETPIKT